MAAAACRFAARAKAAGQVPVQRYAQAQAQVRPEGRQASRWQALRESGPEQALRTGGCACSRGRRRGNRLCPQRRCRYGGDRSRRFFDNRDHSALFRAAAPGHGNQGDQGDKARCQPQPDRSVVLCRLVGWRSARQVRMGQVRFGGGQERLLPARWLAPLAQARPHRALVRHPAADVSRSFRCAERVSGSAAGARSRVRGVGAGVVCGTGTGVTTGGGVVGAGAGSVLTGGGNSASTGPCTLLGGASAGAPGRRSNPPEGVCDCAALMPGAANASASSAAAT